MKTSTALCYSCPCNEHTEEHGNRAYINYCSTNRHYCEFTRCLHKKEAFCKPQWHRRAVLVGSCMFVTDWCNAVFTWIAIHSELCVPDIRSKVRRIFLSNLEREASSHVPLSHDLAVLFSIADTLPRIRCALVFMVSCPADLRRI